jgi:hypothetical protein
MNHVPNALLLAATMAQVTGQLVPAPLAAVPRAAPLPTNRQQRRLLTSSRDPDGARDFGIWPRSLAYRYPYRY